MRCQPVTTPISLNVILIACIQIYNSPINNSTTTNRCHPDAMGRRHLLYLLYTSFARPPSSPPYFTVPPPPPPPLLFRKVIPSPPRLIILTITCVKQSRLGTL
ncbi:hypothetical protein Hanom_Chr08g00740641 [Helianthus anomalus]